jgi:hypothetical protein
VSKKSSEDLIAERTNGPPELQSSLGVAGQKAKGCRSNHLRQP